MKTQLTKKTAGIVEHDRKIHFSTGKIICGVDEAGRGPLAGPVVAAAVIFSSGVFIDGVYDSKAISEHERDRLYNEIRKNALTYTVGIVDNHAIDKTNILEATKLAMRNAIRKLSVKPGIALVDGNFYKSKELKVINIIKGDQKSFHIAAASIIAKVTRDRIMFKHEKKYPRYSFSHHKGYATKKHIEEIINHGYCKIHRLSFHPKALNEQLTLF
jgi:ribonuclease HII